MTTRQPNTAQAIGALAAQLEALNARLDRDRQDREKTDEKADKARAEVKHSLSKLQSGHEDILRRVDKIEPVTEMVTGFKAKAIGALFVLGLIGSAVISFLVYFKQQITQLIWGA